MKVIPTICLNGLNQDDKRSEIKKYFNQTFELYETLFSLIKCADSFYKKPEPLRHPLIFYFAHTASFYINKLIVAKEDIKSIDSYIESISAIGVDEMSWDDLDQKNYDWPSLEDVKLYRSKVKDVVNNFIDSMNLKLPIQWDDSAWVILMGIEHERIHLETSAVIIRMLPLEELDSSTNSLFNKPCLESDISPINSLAKVNGATVVLGKDDTDSTFGWDIEYGTETRKISDFFVSKYLVSNGEFLDFIKDKGYQNYDYWDREGKQWLKYTKATCPRFWIRKSEEYYLRNLTSECLLPLNWPVEVNCLEAIAFCNWKSLQLKQKVELPSESHYYILRDRIDYGQKTDFSKSTNKLEDESEQKKINAPGNINLEYFSSSCPINKFETDGIFDIIGNVWQWTSTPVYSYLNFKPHAIYDDFSIPTLDGKHNLIKGGSWVSTGNEVIKNARYAFRRHFTQFAGFRYMLDNQSLDSGKKTMNNKINIVSTKNELINNNNLSSIYEQDKIVAEYLEFHYGEDYFNVKNFPVNCVTECMNIIDLEHFEKCLDLGCSVGRSTFELANYFKEVDGIDFSARFIQMCFAIKDSKMLKYNSQVEGNICLEKSISLEELNLRDNADRINFSQGDAHNLKPEFNNYDLVFCGNLIDRLYNPKKFLINIVERINKNGYLVLTSPYTWLEEYTPKEKWIGGYINNANKNEIFTIQGLKNILEDKLNFKLVKQTDIPFVIKETSRKFQHSISEMTIWKKE